MYYTFNIIVKLNDVIYFSSVLSKKETNTSLQGIRVYEEGLSYFWTRDCSEWKGQER